MSEVPGTAIWSRGEPYERYMGRWSRLVAREFVRDLGLPPSLCWLDVGCGTGALSNAILTQALPREVVAVEPSEGMLAAARRQVREGVRFLEGDAGRIPMEDASVDVAVSGLVLNFVPDLGGALTEMRRVVRPRGIIAAYVWDYAEGMQMLRHFWDAAVGLRPAARELDEGVRFASCNPATLSAAFARADLIDVAVAPIAVSLGYRDFDEFWAPFLEGVGPAPSYVRSLDETQAVQLREQVRARLPVRDDGSFTLSARAWAVKGRRVR